MGRNTSPGLYKRDGIWHIDKRIKGHGRLCESTGTGEREEAERYLRLKLTEIGKQLSMASDLVICFARPQRSIC